ncbi:Polyhydroxybutyrate depolymerase [Tolypocladium paradoxum]|uniref:Polyhydroxybutyrate depolymerase n=1 Tax=Tolypocladium paradoxum TaxID=94208 RepID=A0A2S4LAS7_9HYPO|nr:Polyhydroxybutyrate depolymerase [Tolypocladium paradoxum]
MDGFNVILNSNGESLGHPDISSLVKSSRYLSLTADMASTLISLGLLLSFITAAALDSYNVDPGSVSVSGLSSDGFMAAQLGIAYSDVLKIGVRGIRRRTV